MIMNDWPPDSVLGSQFGYKKKKDGKEVDNAFFGISVPITQRRTVPRWFCSPFGGREGSKQAVAVVGKQGSKQVPSFKCKRTAVVLRTCPSSLFPPPRRQITGALYMPGGNVYKQYTLFLPQNLPIHRYTKMSTPLSNAFRLVLSRLVSSCIVEKGYVLLDT